MKKNKSNTNLLDLIPLRNLKWMTNDKNQVILLKPKFSNRWLAKYLLPKMKNPSLKISLDQFGSFVWNNCDGKANVQEIATKLKAEFGDQIEPVHERLSLFIQTLERNKFIYYADYP